MTVPMNKPSESPEKFYPESPMKSEDIRSTDSDGLYFLSTPPSRSSEVSAKKLSLAIAPGGGAAVSDQITRNRLANLFKENPRNRFQLLSQDKDLNINWAPDLVECLYTNEGLTETTYSLSDESAMGEPESPPSPGEMPLESESSSSHSTLVPESISTLTSTSPRDISHNSSEQLLYSQGQRIKEKIVLYENMCHKNKEKSRDTFNHPNYPGDFDHNLYPTMKLRKANILGPDQSSDQEHSRQMLADLSLSPGHNLSLPKRPGMRRKVSYRIRYAFPNRKDSDQTINVDDNENVDAILEKVDDRNGGGKSGTYNGKIEEAEEAHGNITDDEESESKSETVGSDFYRPPDVWITPIKSKDGSQKWIAKRVWDVEERDDVEPEYEVDHCCLMRGVRGLMGIPEEMGLIPEEWQVNIDESNPWEMAASNDVAPTYPKRATYEYGTPLSLRQIFDVDGHRQASTSILRNDDDFYNQLLSFVSFPHLEESVGECSRDTEDLTDESTFSNLSDSNTSFISLVDYFDFYDSDTSCSVSLQTTSDADDDSCQLQPELDLETALGSQGAHQESSNFPKVSFHSKIGFGRPDEWIRPQNEFEDVPANHWVWKTHQHSLDTQGGYASPNDADEDSSESSKDTERNRHNQRGFGRPDGWIRSKNVYEDSSECGRSYSGKYTSYSEGGIGRGDVWIHPNDSCGASTECRSCFSSLASRTTQDKAARESSPEGDSPVSCKGVFKESPSHPITLGEYLDTHNSEHTKRIDGGSGGCTGETFLRQKGNKKEKKQRTGGKSPSSATYNNTCSIHSDSHEGQRLGPPTWQKRNLQQKEEESAIKLWWEV